MSRYALVGQLTVEIAFTTSPDDASPSWVDVTSRVRNQQVTITRGRGDEFSQVQPSRLTLTLDNSDGRFSAGYTSGLYYPYVKPNRKIRVTTTSPATSRFTGYIEEWPTTWEAAGKTSTVTITATDRLSRLGNIAKFKSLIEQEILMDSPVAYYTLGEDSGATSAGDSSGAGQQPAVQTQLGAGGTAVFGNGTGPAYDSLTALELTPVNASNGLYFVAPLPLSGITDLTVEVVFNTTAVSQTILALETVTGDTWATVTVNASGKLVTTPGSVASTASVNDGTTHVVTLKLHYAATSTWEYFIDGTTANNGTFDGFFFHRSLTRLLIGGSSASVFSGTLSHAAVYTSALSSARISAQALAITAGHSGISSDSVITLYAGYAGIASADLDLEAGASTSISYIDITGKSPATAMQDVTDTESGVLFFAGDGRLTFHARSHRYNASVAATIAASNLKQDLQVVTNKFGLVNDVTASRDGGISFRAVNSSSVTDYGTFNGDRTLYTTSNNEVIDAANWGANQNATPVPRVTSLGIDILPRSSSVQNAVLALEIGDLISVTGLTAPPAPSTSLSFFIEGWTETWTATSVEFALNASPAVQSSVWVLDSSTYSVLDSTTRPAY